MRGTYLALLVVLGLRFKIFLDSLPIAWQVDASCPMVRSVHIQQSFHIANRHGICLDDLRHTRAFIITLLPNKLGTDDKTVDSATSMLARHSPARFRTILKGPLVQQLRRRQPARCPAYFHRLLSPPPAGCSAYSSPLGWKSRRKARGRYVGATTSDMSRIDAAHLRAHLCSELSDEVHAIIRTNI